MSRQILVRPDIENRFAPLESGSELGDNWDSVLSKCNANFLELYAASNGVGAGVVTMFPDQNQASGGGNAWFVIDPFGSAVDTSGTQTQGLQEAINYSVYNGCPLVVQGRGGLTLLRSTGNTHSNTTVNGLSSTSSLTADGSTRITGPGIPSFTVVTAIVDAHTVTISNAATATASGVALRFARDPVDLSCNTSINVPAAQLWAADIYANLIMAPNCGLNFDSCMNVDFRLRGEIVGSGNVPLVKFAPTNPVPFDGFPIVTDSRFYILAVAHGGDASGSVVLLDPTIASIGSNYFQFIELNGSGVTGTGLTAKGFTGETAVVDNVFDIVATHDTASVGISAGILGGTVVSANTWRIGSIGVNNGAIGLSIFSSNDIFDCSGIGSGGTGAQGVVFQSASSGNIARISGISGFTTAITSGGTNNVLLNDGKYYLSASTAARSSLRIPSGVAPTSPVDGDMWYDGANVKIRVGGTTKTFTLT